MAKDEKDSNKLNQIDKSKYSPYTQSQIIDNTISCLLAPKRIEENRKCCM